MWPAAGWHVVEHSPRRIEGGGGGLSSSRGRGGSKPTGHNTINTKIMKVAFARLCKQAPVKLAAALRRRCPQSTSAPSFSLQGAKRQE